MEKTICLLKSVADVNRLRIINLLDQKEMCVCELSHVLGITQPSVSRHLKKMREAHLLDCKKDGFWTTYFLLKGNDKVQLLCTMINQLVDDRQMFERDMAQIGKLDRTKLCCKG